MSEVRVTAPRRAGAIISLHAADICQIIMQDDIMGAFNEDELHRMASRIEKEIMFRQPPEGEENANHFTATEQV